jgi:excisionase family DNA binding protein
MQETFPLPNIPGYVSIKQAAKILGVTESTMYRYVEAGRIPAVQAGHNIMMPEEAVKQFKPKLTGRPRRKVPIWRASPDSSPLLVTSIRIQVHPGQRARLVEKLLKIKQEERHLFPGTVARYVSQEQAEASPATVTLQLVWKQNEAPPEAERRQALEEFATELADVLDWSTAEYSTSKAIIHT